MYLNSDYVFKYSLFRADADEVGGASRTSRRDCRPYPGWLE